jgi:CheY-like chemotaxis protein
VLNPVHLLRETQKIVDETFPRNINTEFRLPREPWRISGDPTQLNQVLMNLCVNARDAMPDGGVLTVSLENVSIDAAFASEHPGGRAGDYVLVRVADTGMGIPASLHSRIFEAFFTTKEDGLGTGLGLSTTKRIVHSHGGFIRVTSEVGRGATFEVYLPASTGVAELASAEGDRSELPRGSGECVLIVDDEESIRAIAQMTLESFGYRVLVAAHGAEAVSIMAARREEIALVLTDMAMPIMDGPATIAALKKLDPGIKIVCSSGNSVEASMAAARKHGVTHFLAKPYAAASLLETVAEVIRNGTQAPTRA